MILMVIGASGSGKSAYAEQRVLALSAERQHSRYYLATMEHSGEEADRRIGRHLQLRKGKGFLTLEYPVHPQQALQEIPDPAQATVLLECVSNLAANAMFGDGYQNRQTPGCPLTHDLLWQLQEEILALAAQVRHLVIVTNDIHEDGCSYPQETAAYIRLLGELNGALARHCDEVVEVVYGCPAVIRKEKETDNL